ncbi:YncE family protein [Ammoniphilus sp. 3BR4]|uniref:YncE family protein n=1 Tax=Ammoniphilus sp. 3BR4 TaxID=3158265 RepID=UPI003466DA6D
MLQDPICHMKYATCEVSLVDPITDTLLDTIHVRLRPSSAIIGPDRLSMYVTYFGADYVSVFNTINHELVAQIALPTANTDGMTIITDQHKLYVLDPKTAQCMVIDPVVNQVMTSGNIRELFSVNSPIGIPEPEGRSSSRILDPTIVQGDTESLGEPIIPNSDPVPENLSIANMMLENAPLESELKPQDPSLSIDLPQLSIPETPIEMPTAFDPQSLLSLQSELQASPSLGALPDLAVNGENALDTSTLSGLLNTGTAQRRLRGNRNTALLLQLRGRIRNLKLPPEMAKKLEDELISATRHLKSFIRNIRLCVNLKLIPFHKAAPIIRIAKKMLS